MPRYRGRFAPSPTGPLHFGSLVAALGSWLDARSQDGQWLVRMEDLDGPRTVPGADADILRILEALGLYWDGEVTYQSSRTGLYAEAFERLRTAGLIFPCGCTRREIADSTLSPAGPGRELVYPGTCRNGLSGTSGKQVRAWRMRVGQACIGFCDRIQGICAQNLEQELGDFVIRRADGPFSYQLAVVVDDAAQTVTHVVRGADLLQSTARQILLQRALGLPKPVYAHLPVAVNATGGKLSKQTLAPRLEPPAVRAALVAALDFLGHTVPEGMQRAAPAELLAWAQQAWDMTRVPAVLQRPAPAEFSSWSDS